ncbi:MAG: pentapeptide repeat-containing protein [Filomicrobium sp.]
MARATARIFTFKLVRVATAALSAAAAAIVLPSAALTQDMMRHVNLETPEFTESSMTRAELQKKLAELNPGETLDLTAAALNGLDMSGLDLRQTKLQSARLNKTNLSGANLEGVVLDQAWALKADLSGANLRNASLFMTQLMDAKMDRADLSGARIAADMSRASLKEALFEKADLSADMTNQSMGLMRGVFKSSDLSGANFRGANLSRASMEYADLRDADLTGANLMGSELAGANLTGAIVAESDFSGADVNSAKLIGLKSLDKARNFDSVKNLDRAFRD